MNPLLSSILLTTSNLLLRRKDRGPLLAGDGPHSFYPPCIPASNLIAYLRDRSARRSLLLRRTAATRGTNSKSEEAQRLPLLILARTH